MREENRDGSWRIGEAAENPSPASSDPIIMPCISQALWPFWCLQRICEQKRNPSRVMVLLYAPRAAIFNPYPSCLSHKLCDHGPVCEQKPGPVVFMLYLRKSEVLLWISLPLLPVFSSSLTRCVRSPASAPFSQSVLLSRQLLRHIVCHRLFCIFSAMSSLALDWVFNTVSIYWEHLHKIFTLYSAALNNNRL